MSGSVVSDWSLSGEESVYGRRPTEEGLAGRGIGRL
jgi:hypothetical protein